MPKPVAFRPSERTEQIISDVMIAKGYEAQSDALNYLIESSQTRQVAQVPETPLRSTPPCVELHGSDKLPASLDRELQHFLRGQDSPLIALILSDFPRHHPNLTTALTALHDA